MGVSIYGVNIPPRSKGEYKTFCYEDFYRSLNKNEITYKKDTDQQTQNGVSVSYGYYNQIREELSLAFLKADCQTVWQRCAKLKKRKKYGRSLYHLVNFADNEGYIGPKAVKQMSRYFKRSKNFNKNISKVPKEYRSYILELIDCIHETAKMESGYLVFS